jgi:glyoxylase-like metal-dependent hydrolase (beta-lactamase superfamily II)
MHVIPIAGDNAGPMTGRGTNTYLIPGAAPTLVDAAESSEAYVERVAATLEAVQPGAALAHVLITHGHPDHVGGVEAIARRWPTATFAKIADPDRDGEHDVAWQALRDDQMTPAGDGALWVVATPGHAPDHAAFFDVRTSVLFGGDLLVNGGTVAIPPSRGGHLGQYLGSLRKVMGLQPRRIFPGHGPPIDNPGALLRGYIGHRLGREQQILDVLAGGAISASEIAQRIYPADLAEALWPAALENVLAHLIKLQEEQRVAIDGEQWMVVSA